MAWNRPVNNSVNAPVRALVLAGGGARGSYQVGVWRALTELGWRPGIITGTSVGSLNGAMFALDLYVKSTVPPLPCFHSLTVAFTSSAFTLSPVGLSGSVMFNVTVWA